MKIFIAPVETTEDADTIISVQNAIELNKEKLSFRDACVCYQKEEPLVIDSATHSEGVWLMDIVKIDRDTETLEVANFTFLS